MPINFDPNSLNSVFDQNFGAGSFNAGLSNAANAARLKQQANFAKTDYLKRLKAAQAAATKAAKASTKKTYQDAVDSLNNDSTTLDTIRNQGAYKAAEDIKNDPVKKQAIKDQGYTVQDYIDSMYNAASNGKFRSEREYNGYASQLGKDTKAANKASQDTVSTPTQTATQKTNQQQQKKSSPGLLSKIGNGLKGIGSEIGAAATAAEQFVNPFDKVSADQAVKNYMNRNQSQGFQEFARGANRAVDSASLGLMSNLDKKLNNRTPYYNSARAIGQGGGTDMITSGLGYLIPGVGAAKGVKALGLGAKTIPALEQGAGLAAKLARGSQIARTVAKEGALVGGALPLAQMGINYAINPKDQNLMNNLTNVGMGIGLGVVGDPILRGLGTLGRNTLALHGKATGELPIVFNGKVNQETLNALTPKLQQGLNSFRELEQKPFKADISNLPLNPTKGIENIKPFSESVQKQVQKDVSNSPLLMSLNPAKTAEKLNPTPKLTPVEQQYQNEFNNAVQQQVDYLKNSMGKGVDRGTTSNGEPGNFKQVTGTYNVSQNPKWYQDFYKTNGRKPNNSELQQLAQEHVLNGFQDEYGNIPSFVPKKIQDINDQIDQAMTIIKQQPEQAPVLKPYLDALSQEKTTAEEEYKQFLMKTNLQMFSKNEPKATNISSTPTADNSMLVYRRDMKNAVINPEQKPHGLYTSLVENPKTFQTPFKEVGNTDYWFKANPKKPLIADEMTVQHERFGYRGEGQASAGVAALHKLLPEDIYDAVIHMRKQDLTNMLKDQFPGPDYSRYHDSYELLEVYAAQLARKQGYDAIILKDSTMPNFSEMTVLKNDVLNPFENPLTSSQKTKEVMFNISPKSVKNDVTAPNPLDNHGYGLALANEPKAKAEPKPKPNPLDAPYKPGEELPNTMGQIGTKTVKQPTSLSHTVDKLKIKTVDNLHRLSQFDKQVEKVFGRELKPSESTHTLGLNSRGSDQISKQILTQNMVDKNGKVIGKSLKEIASKVPKGKLSEFEDYLVNKHAITRMKRGEKVFPNEMKMTTGKSEEIVKRYEQANPQFKELAKEVYNYNKQLGQKWLVDTGVLSKDQWEGYLKANPNYVPNNRIFSDLEMPKFGNNAKKGFANQSNPVKKATGSQRQIVSPIESMIEHTAQYVKTAKRNEVMQSLINNIKQDPEAFKDWAEIIPTKDGSGTFLDSISNKLKNEGIDGILEEFNKAFDQKPDLAKGNIVAGIIDGKKVHIRVHDVHLLDAITNLQPKAQNLVISALGQVTRVMKNLTTGINPVFSLTRNIFRDIPTAYVNSKSTNNPLTFSKDLVQSIVSIMKNDSLYKSFKAVGGGHSSPISSDVNLLAQSKQAILPQKGIKSLLGKGLGALENLNNAVESAPRLAEFKRLAGNTYDSKMKALYEANDVTVNFNKYGNWAKEVDAVVPYFNAAIQGLDKQWRVLASPGTPKAEKITAAVKAFVGITIPTMLLYNVNHNDPNYQKVSNYVKDTNLLIPKGDGTFYKIPKPRELGVMFGSDVERVLRAWQDSDPKAFQDFATTIMDTFAPPVRTVLAPFSDLRANKNFANAPIVPQDLQGLSPRYQYDSKTSGPAKAIGNLLNVSPKQIDYLTKSYGGILGELGIPATTKDTTIADTLKQKVTVDSVFSNDLQRNFYDMKTKLDQAHSDLSKQGIQNPNLNEGLRKFMNTQATQMSKVRKQMKTVQNNSSLTPDERLRRLRMLQDQINQIAASANQLSR